MTEPVSTTIGGVAAWKAFGVTIVVALCVVAVAAVVFMSRMPRSPREWGVGLICTIVSSLAGGSFIIVKFGLHEWANDVWGMLVIGGFFFTCGLPGWALVRWIFNYIDKKEGSDIFEVAKEIKKDFKEFKDQ